MQTLCWTACDLRASNAPDTFPVISAGPEGCSSPIKRSSHDCWLVVLRSIWGIRPRAQEWEAGGLPSVLALLCDSEQIPPLLWAPFLSCYVQQEYHHSAWGRGLLRSDEIMYMKFLNTLNSNHWTKEKYFYSAFSSLLPQDTKGTF